MSNVQFIQDFPLWPGLKPAIPMIVAQGTTQTSEAGSATTKDIAGSLVTVPKGYFEPGTTFKFTLAGTRSGTAGATTLLIAIGSTTVISIACPANTAVDWMAEFWITEHTNLKMQRCFGRFLMETEDAAVDYADGTVDVSNEVVIKARMTNASNSDVSYCNFVMVECWKF